jgi:hypothetical protein
MPRNRLGRIILASLREYQLEGNDVSRGASQVVIQYCTTTRGVTDHRWAGIVGKQHFPIAACQPP